MGKKGGRRKRLRTDRQARAARQRAVRQRVASQRQELVEEAVRVAGERMERMCDPETPVEELADLLAGQYDGGPVPPGIAELLREKGSSPERLVSAAEMMLAADCADGGSPSVTALTFRAAAARVAKDTGQARDFLDQALAAAGHDDDPDALVEMIDHLHQCGHLADAIEMFEARMREAPDDTHAAGHYGAAIAEAWVRVTGGEPVGECPCGAGRPWGDCCGPREHAAVGRFGDRSGLTALREAVAAYLPGSAYGQAIDDEVAEYLSLAEDTDWEPAERSALADLVAELGLVTAGADGADDPGPGQGEDTDNVLTAFAAGPSVPAELAASARAWRDHIHYGLWRIDDPDPAPGVWFTDIVSGATRYVEFPPAAAERLARWMVWAGAVVPVGGIWRSSGMGVPLSPAEADAAAEVVQASTEAIVGELAGKGKKGATRRAAQPMPFGRAQPHGVLIDLSEPASPEVTRFIGMITAAVLARIAVEVHDHRVAPPALSNTDGDPMCLITARITVRDAGNGGGAAGGGEAIARRLAGHPDFDRDPGEPARLSWLGLEMPEGQRAAMLAEVRAQLAASGQHAARLEEPSGPQRWVRGQIRIEGGGLVAEVNSRERLRRLLDLLDELGMTATVTDEKRVDPALDLAWQPGPRAFAGGAAPAAEGWEKCWLDEPVPALGGRTPRQAARSKDPARLEALLRQFEYEADLLAAEGKTGIDAAWLRQELDMAGFD